MEGILNESEFVPLVLDRRELRQLGNLYHVYHSPSEFKEVEADSAYDAMTRSEITKPFKISRYALKNMSVLRCGMLDDGAAFAQLTPEAETQAVTEDLSVPTPLEA
jgi:hypothetical protein